LDWIDMLSATDWHQERQYMSEVQQSGRRDDLALVRTDLANERTLLAYGRTALMVVATGFSLIKFFGESPVLRSLGWGLAILGAAIGWIGLVRFTRLNKRLRQSNN
jgi:putative membrane protein